MRDSPWFKTESVLGALVTPVQYEIKGTSYDLGWESRLGDCIRFSSRASRVSWTAPRAVKQRVFAYDCGSGGFRGLAGCTGPRVLRTGAALYLAKFLVLPWFLMLVRIVFISRYRIPYPKSFSFYTSLVTPNTYPSPLSITRPLGKAKSQKPGVPFHSIPSSLRYTKICPKPLPSPKDNQPKRLGSNLGLFSTIVSIFSIISGVNFSACFTASTFSRTCSGLLAPVMTLEILRFLMIQAIASWERVIPSSLATVCVTLLVHCDT